MYNVLVILITGNTNSRTSQGVGYTKKYEHHKEGDIWEEDGRTVDY